VHAFSKSLASCFAVIWFWSEGAKALPIGFGRPQGDLVYDEIQSPHFSLYHDRRAPSEARVVLESLTAARPIMEQWLGIKRAKPLPVILSASTSEPSFANFITDAIELQTMGRGGRDLAWHEYTHSSMYRHLDNVFGPAGSILHLPWMPAWWIEGLAEAFSVSGGSDLQYGVERYYAFTGRWPSYDKLHALYDGSRFSGIGYAISGAFVSYILRTYGADKLPTLLESFYRYSMPWWWPYTFVPFAHFMPMDEALHEYTGKSGEQLYEEYKQAATQYWKDRSGLPLYEAGGNGELKITEREPTNAATPPAPHKPGQAMTFNSTYQIQSRKDRLYFVNRDGSDLFEAEVVWRQDAVSDFIRRTDLPKDAYGARVIRDDFQIFLTGELNHNREPTRIFWIHRDKTKKAFLSRKAFVTDIMLSADKLIWLEEFIEANRLCYIPRSLLDQKGKVRPEQIRCPIQMTFPKSLHLLGTRMTSDANGADIVREIWLTQSEETIYGDRYKVLRWNTDSRQTQDLVLSHRGKPLSLAFHGTRIWVAVAGRQHHVLRRIDESGRCLEERDIANIVDRLYNSNQNALLMSLWQENGLSLVRVDSNATAAKPCRTLDEPSSPLQLAMRKPNRSLTELIRAHDPWQTRPDATILAEANQLTQASLLGQKPEVDGKPVRSQEASWRPRPVFAFPWIGIDALGYQIGTLSVPLMDHLQNETLQLSALYGTESRYPNLELNLTSSRFDTIWSFEVFRRQTWNGVFRNRVYYFDERGAEVSAARYLESIDTSLRMTYKNSWMLPYIGDQTIWPFLAKGYLRELSLGLSRTDSFEWGYLSSSVNSNLATKQFNKNYDYEQLGLGLNLGLPLTIFDIPSSQSWGLSYSRVRGTRRKLLREAYRPLRTFVPGSGGGLNEINQTLVGPGALTSAVYGDTQARAQFSWTIPLVTDLAKLIHIVYLQRLDFSMFYNYGTAWFHSETKPTLTDGTRAHGYNLDLQADVKGVKLNLGLGVGQVVGNDFEAYVLFGFDALIDQDKR
jgi:hypothetical protein